MANFFIDRPIFAWVLAIILCLTGALAIFSLPVEQYPNLAPPNVRISATYPGASAQTLENTVTQIIEQNMTGLDNMMYMSSQSTNTGQATVTLTFEAGTDPNEAMQQVQNQLQAAIKRLPQAVQNQGVTVSKSGDTTLMMVAFVSTDNSMDKQDIADYIVSNLQDPLSRINGVGSMDVYGSQYAMRIWLDPNKLNSYQLTTQDVVKAIQSQNAQVAVGQLGGTPSVDKQALNATINAQSQLQTPEQFRQITLRVNQDGSLVTLGNVATVELGGENYNYLSRYNGMQAAGMNIKLASGANELQTDQLVKDKIAELSQYFPHGLEAKVAYETTPFVKASIKDVVKTLLEAILLVFLVMYLFLQNFRATLIPTIAVPVVLMGTFAILSACGFSINTLTMFAMVLAIGLLVDDAIVVVENVERNIEEGLSPLAAAHQAMREVSGPIIAIAVVLCAVFVPMAFLSGVTGQFYKQFAVTIAISTVISAINSLTLSPALAARLLKPHGAPKDLPSRLIDRLFGWLFRPFNRFFASGSQRYQHGVSRVLGRRGAVFVVYLLLLAAAGVMFKTVPGGFIPTQDKLYLIGGVKMPEGASLERTDAVIRKMSAIGLSVDGVTDAVAFPGLNALQFTNTPNTGTVFFALESLSTRTRTAAQINAEINARISQIQEGFAFSIMPPPILGIGQGSGYSLYVQDRAGLGYGALQTAINTMSGAIMQTPGMGFPISSYQANVPQLDAKIDRDKAKAQGVPLNALFSTLQTYLGSSYINDFNRYGRTWKVMAQADGQFRDSVEDIANLRTRNDKGEMVPIGSMVSIGTTYGPDPVIRYNGFPAADLIGDADPRVLSSTQAMGALTQMAGKLLPNGMNIQWTDLSYQQSTQGNAALVVFPVAVLLAFLALAALYESWTLPLAVILIVPMTMLSALFGVWLTGGDNNVFVQVGLVVLMGLACKNAILIVEFARELEMQGKGIVEAALEACRLRLRPIVMTSIAFIAGTIPLILGHGAGAEVRGVTGITVFSGMLGVTLFGLFLTPVFYVTLRRLVARKAQPQTA
ncbi:efflux RND transporter permease subunit [Serratia marcescens]|uniref:efflux RND transporter permease subunit n=1 Tax=Serratia marcescens TaxID=615 RepID=UPI000F7E2B34|nr:efflux RND transporter permease subunit [Serratia marcescens]RTF33517.1 multidrug efflux RND transporter permease subunit [Serratia marcescens]RTF93350.1 multidrug efflux RND transporter permease subunit [Serratia marcescens]RTG28588.1 multidrug efflux RND transporter permease subunit [Serratia marcescens]RTG41212.1 multidrug efflux RND transporter permease subunit [Serratia marcescens]